MTLSNHDDDAFARGVAMRTAVMGETHVVRSGGTDKDTATDLQRYVTEFGWGTIWQRGTLPLPVRSLLTVAMLIALGRPHELAGHLRGALNNGCTPEELRETVIHAIAYCGFPAAIDAMRILDGILADE
ncbi:carboxymuconolactone decarboxylase family protein [Microbacterium sp. NPDC078428]|uniref:carboxymuconolactone decarboxylase family protein n=1 Tax=Microbacterium sp. NPDC078428 TaxID=3364190 RepID=UPI0037C684D2